jgi:hypothetical protein
VITLDTATTLAIKSFATDAFQQNSFEALMDYFGVTSLQAITQEMGEAFLAKLESGEIRIPREI